MTEADLLLVAVAAAAWVNWVPAVSRLEPGAAARRQPTTVEWLTRLRAQLVVSADFATALSQLPAPPDAVGERLERLSALSSAIGISALGPVKLLLLAARQEAQLRARWRERSGAAMVSSTLLAILPVGLWLTSGSVGASPIEWLVSSPAGWLALGAFLGLTALSRWFLRRAARSALGGGKAAVPGEVGGLRPLRSPLAAAVSFIAVWSVRPDGLGFALAALVASGVGQAWRAFPSGQQQALATMAEAERPWLTALLASALAAGLDWRRAVGLLAQEAQVDREQLLAVERRLSWGVEPAVAFASAGEQWQEVAVAIAQTMSAGAPVASGLAALSEHWQRELGESAIERVERVAARAVIPVSLLQLPAFIIGGLLPILAVSLQPLLDSWLSTSP